MRSDRIHHDRERKYMAAHREDQEENLSAAEHFPPDPASHDFARVSHVVDMRIGEFELSNHIAGIRRDDTEAYDQDDTAGEMVNRMLPGSRKNRLTVRCRRRRERREERGSRGKWFRQP